MSQSKLSSLAEAVVNTAIGLFVAMFATAGICKAYDIPMTWENNFIITFWMTVLSIARSYAVRRAWNAEFWKQWLAQWRYRKIDPICAAGARSWGKVEACQHGGCRSAKEHAIAREVGNG